MSSKSTRAARTARIVIADDHELTRIGLRGLLESERNLEIVGEAGNGSDALELCQKLQPDLAILDLRMPQMDGLAATRAIKQVSPRTSIIIVTLHAAPEYVLEALEAGASGYVLKEAPNSELLQTARQVLRGETILNPTFVKRMMRKISQPSQSSTPALNQLTTRELAVLRLVAKGATNREIADQLTISVGTVKIHVEHIISKLEVSDRTQAAVRAIQLGILATADQ